MSRRDVFGNEYQYSFERGFWNFGVYIGSDPRCDIVLSGTGIEPVHAHVQWAGHHGYATAFAPLYDATRALPIGEKKRIGGPLVLGAWSVNVSKQLDSTLPVAAVPLRTFALEPNVRTPPVNTTAYVDAVVTRIRSQSKRATPLPAIERFTRCEHITRFLEACAAYELEFSIGPITFSTQRFGERVPPITAHGMTTHPEQLVLGSLSDTAKLVVCVVGNEIVDQVYVREPDDRFLGRQPATLDAVFGRAYELDGHLQSS